MPIFWWLKKRKVKKLRKEFDDAIRLVRNGDDGDLQIGARLARDASAELCRLGYCPETPSMHRRMNH